MRYLVALAEDNDEKSVNENKMLMEVALRHAVAGRDCLLLARVIEELKPDPAIALLDILCDEDEQIRIEEEARKKLELYNKMCMDAGVDSAFVVLVDDHPGSALCKAVAEHRADCMVVGRRDMGTLQRLITVSTSKYCVDNADCNVIVVKRPYIAEEMPSPALAKQKQILQQAELDQLASESSAPQLFTLRDPEEMKRAFERSAQPTSEQLDSPNPLAIEQTIEPMKASEERRANLELVKQLEEEERADRIKDKEIEDKNIEEEREKESKQDRILVAQLEEEERARRIAEEKKQIKKENKQRVLERTKSLERLHIAEEQERMERINALKDEEVKEQASSEEHSKSDRELCKKLWEEEQERRIKEDQDLKKEREEESKLDLLKVKEMEEQERNRRVKKSMKVQQ